MSSSVLQNKITYSILYPDMDLFSLPPKNFGSFCFIHNHNSHKIKLNPRSLRGIFLSYSITQKGYKCFCPSFSRYFLLADVTFFESTPRVSTSSLVASDGDYDYLFYQEILINSGKSSVNI